MQWTWQSTFATSKKNDVNAFAVTKKQCFGKRQIDTAFWKNQFSAYFNEIIVLRKKRDEHLAYFQSLIRFQVSFGNSA